MDILLASAALAAIPVVLWAVPAFRRRRGRWISPAKTVPCGCLAMLLIPALLWRVWMLHFGADREPLNRWMLGLSVAVGIAAGIAVIRLAEGLQRRVAPAAEEKTPGEGSRRREFYFATFILCLMLGFGGCVAGNVVTYARAMRGNYRGEWRYTTVLREGKVRVDFGSQSIHPFLAEYNYGLRFDDGQRRSTHFLHVNCGGRTFFNVRRLPDGRLHLADKDAEYLVDPRSRAVLKLIREGRDLYTVPYPDELVTSWSGLCDLNGKKHCDFNLRRVEATPADGVLDGEVYFGRITRRFQPAAEAPELPLSEWRNVR